MKRKMVVALLAAMTLTLGTVGITFASPENPAAGVESTKDTEERPGYIWVIDKEAVYETVVHPEEGHYETVYHEAEYETVYHEAEGYYETVKHDAEGYYETVHHEEEGHYETQQVQVGTEPVYEIHRIISCNLCGTQLGDQTTGEYLDGGDLEHAINYHSHFSHADGSISYTTQNVDVQVGEKPVYEDQQVWVVDKESYEEQIWHETKPAWEEQVWHETKPAWTEEILVNEAWEESVWTVDKESWTEQVLVSPEEGHWEPVSAENPDPENPETEEPTTPVEPENPDTEEPTPTTEPETPASDDTETPDSDNAGANQEAVPTPEQTATDNSQTTDENKSQAADTASSEDKKADQETTTVPKTGDPTNLGYLVSLAGSALAGGSALVWKFRKRK